MGINKQYLKKKNVCKVTFRLAKKETATKASSVHLVGDFNDWNEKSHPMKKLKKGGFILTLELEKGKEYQFRYLIDDKSWQNDWEADKYVQTPFGNCENSVVVV
ncbi:isoamylase early set domain-containing protein [Planctomycetota bacterium]